MNKKLLGALALVLPFSTSADIIGLTAGAYSWNQGWDGNLQSDQAGSTQVDVEDNLGYDDERGNSFFVAFEHPIPLLPNIRLAHTEMDISENNNSSTFFFDGNPYNGNVSSELDLSHTDATLYYEILDNVISLDIGLTARRFDGKAEITDNTTNTTGTADIDVTIPLLFAGARVALPLTGLYAAGEIHGLSAGGDSITDTKLSIGYEVGIVALELGYRSFDIDVEGDDDEEFDLTVDGAFLGFVVDI